MNEIRKRRTAITIETRTVTIIRARNAVSNQSYCEACGSKVTALSLHHAALIFRVAESELELFSRGGEIHTTEDAKLCGDSLARYFDQEIRYVED